MRCYAFQMWDGDELILDLIPVRKKGVGYMYDRVRGLLIGASHDSTRPNDPGYFVIGPDGDGEDVPPGSVTEFDLPWSGTDQPGIE